MKPLPLEIREALETDIPAIEVMLRELISKSQYAPCLSYSPRKALEALTGAIHSDAIYLAYVELNSPVGFLLGSRAYVPWSEDQMGIEMYWYVYPEYQNLGVGKVLKKMFEDWCRENGCVCNTMGNGLGIETEELVDNYLIKDGYVPVEKMYVQCL